MISIEGLIDKVEVMLLSSYFIACPVFYRPAFNGTNDIVKFFEILVLNFMDLLLISILIILLNSSK